MDQKVIDILTGSIKAHFKPGPGNTKFRYVKGEDVISRLNQAFEHEWSSRVEDTRESGNQIIVLVSIEANGVTHHGFGGAEIAVYRSGEKKGQPVDMSNSYKAAYTNALKKAAEQFGVGLLSEDEFVPETPEPTIPRHNAPPAPSAAPAGPVSTTATIKTAAPVSAPQSQQDFMAALSNIDINKMQKQLETMLAGAAPAEAPATAPTAPAPKAESLAQSYKKSADNKGDYDPTGSRQPDVPNPFTPSSPGGETINDIQLNALGGLAKMKKMTTDKAIKLGLPESTKTEYEELTRDEAKAVIKALNSLEG